MRDFLLRFRDSFRDLIEGCFGPVSPSLIVDRLKDHGQTNAFIQSHIVSDFRERRLELRTLMDGDLSSAIQLEFGLALFASDTRTPRCELETGMNGKSIMADICIAI